MMNILQKWFPDRLIRRIVRASLLNSATHLSSLSARPLIVRPLNGPQRTHRGLFFIGFCPTLTQARFITKQTDFYGISIQSAGQHFARA